MVLIVGLLTLVAFVAVAMAQQKAAPAAPAATVAPAKPATTPAPAPTSSKPSVITRVETWTRKQWDAAQKEWAKDKAKWADCRKQSKAQKLSGRKSWSFLYQCMTN